MQGVRAGDTNNAYARRTERGRDRGDSVGHIARHGRFTPKLGRAGGPEGCGRQPLANSPRGAQRPLVFPSKHPAFGVDTDVAPRENLVRGTAPANKPVDVHAGLSAGPLPPLEVEPFIPRVKPAAELPCPPDGPPDSPVAERQQRLHGAVVGIVPVQLYRPVPKR